VETAPAAEPALVSQPEPAIKPIVISAEQPAEVKKRGWWRR
jgi:hypothetical protein